MSLKIKALNGLFLFFILCPLSRVYALCSGLGCNCTVAAQNLAFGSYNPLTSPALSTSGNISVTCSGLVIVTVSYTVTLSAGISGNILNRNFGAGKPSYNIYIDSGYTQIFGDTTQGNYYTESYTAVSLAPTTKTYTMYARFPVQPTAAPGSYTDTLTVTITY